MVTETMTWATSRQRKMLMDSFAEYRYKRGLQEVERLGYDLECRVGSDPHEIERHFAQWGGTPTEQYYKRRMYKLVQPHVGDALFLAFWRDDASIVFVYCFPSMITTTTMDAEEDRKRAWLNMLEQDRESVQAAARADRDICAAALEIRRIHGTDELTFYFDLRNEGIEEILPLKVSVFEGDESRLEI